MYQKYNSKKVKKNRIHLPGNLWTAVVLVILLLAVAGSLVFVHYKNKPVTAAGTVRPTNSVSYSPPTKQDKAAVNQNKQQIVASSTASKDGTSSSSQSSGSVAATITRYNSATSSTPLSVGVLVSGATSGTCTYTFSMSGQASFSQDFPIVFQATSASCNAASIPASDFSSSGNWTMSIVASDGSQSSPAVQQTVEVSK